MLAFLLNFLPHFFVFLEDHLLEPILSQRVVGLFARHAGSTANGGLYANDAEEAYGVLTLYLVHALAIPIFADDDVILIWSGVFRLVFIFFSIRAFQVLFKNIGRFLSDLG